MSASALYTRAEELNKQKDGVITNGAPNADYGKFPLEQLNEVNGMRGNSLFEMSESNTVPLNLFAASPVGQPYINLYSVWDKGPMIEAYDTYYSLQEAQGDENGTKITMEVLLSLATVTDFEDSNAIAVLEMPEEPARAADTTYYTIIDYSPTDFTNLHHDGSVTITFRAIDSVGNVTVKRVTVHIVDTSGTEIKSHRHDVRFISKQYLYTLDSDSIWNTNPEYKAELMEVLDNERINMERTKDIPIFGGLFERDIPGSGEWKTAPQQTWKFTREEIKKVQAFIDANGFGKTESEDALKRFLDEFASCRQ